jgi:hypothetical protein
MSKIMGAAFHFFLVAIFVGSCLVGWADSVQAQSQAPDKAFVSFRVAVGQWESDERFEELLALFERHKGVTDEITFFHSVTHSVIPLEEVERRCKILKRRMAAVRKLGYRTGINILTTIGHHSEDLGRSLKGDYTPFTNQDGNPCRGVFCPNDRRYHPYIVRLYELVAEANPDYIWLDDDIRSGHGGGYGCFCENCLKLFAKRTGKLYTREELRKAFVTGTEAERIALRKQWLAHNRETIDGVLALAEKAAHRIKPGLALGFMTGDRFYEGYDFANWAKTLAGENGSPVWWRPGGGFYNDQRPAGALEKMHAIGRQVSTLPPWVVSIQSEIENFPYHRLRKSLKMNTFEAACYIASGCTGAAFNVLWITDDPLDGFEPFIAGIHQNRPFYDLMTRHLGRKPLVGVCAAWNPNAAAVSDPSGGNWHSISGFLNGQTSSLYEAGIPVGYNPGQATVRFFSGDMANAFSDDQIRQMLADGVYLDAAALNVLNRRGFGELTGFEPAETISVDAVEKMLDHPLNGPYAGRHCDMRQSFFRTPAHLFRPTAEGAQSLSMLVDYGEKPFGDCALGVFENRLGGRVCVAGYFPWTQHHDVPKSTQLKSIMRWLSRDRLPGYVRSFHKVTPLIRKSENGEVALALANANFDPAEKVELLLRTDQKTLTAIDCRGKRTKIDFDGTDGPYRRFVIPRIEPWEVQLVISEE